MKKIISMLLVALLVVTLVACGNDKSEKKKESVEKESQSAYEGRTLKEIEDMGFRIYSWGSGSDFSASVNIDGVEMTAEAEDSPAIMFIAENSDGLNLQFDIKLSEEEFKTFDNLDFNEKEEYINENLYNRKISNCMEFYSIHTKTQLYNLADKGILVRNKKLEGKTIGTLMEKGYRYDNCDKEDDDYIITMIDENSEECYMILNLSGTDIDVSIWEDGESFKDFTVIECYTFK